MRNQLWDCSRFDEPNKFNSKKISPVCEYMDETIEFGRVTYSYLSKWNMKLLNSLEKLMEFTQTHKQLNKFDGTF